MTGRAPELERIDSLLAGAVGGRAGTLVLEGASGIGKTTLLRASVARATGFTCLVAGGVEGDGSWAHGTLLELLRPLRRHLADVPDGHAAALSGALGWADPPAPGSRFLVAAGTLSLLAAAAEHAPLLVLVDDVQWVDPESAGALLFAARRMHSDRVAFLLAQRPGSPHAVDGLDVLRVPELSAGAAAELLAPHATGAVAARISARIGGNPLALLEVTGRLDPAQRRGTAPLPDVLPLGADLTGIFEPALAALSPDGRAALTVLAAARDGRVSHVATALGRFGVDASAALDEVCGHTLVAREGDALVFRHPLLRTAVWYAATPADRRTAHRALADSARTGDVATRLWHLSRATEGRDDALADELVALAATTRSHAGFAAASLVWERAADLTTDAATAADRLAAAVADAFLSGEVGRTRALADRVRAEDGASSRAAALVALGRLEAHSGSIPAARDLLVEATEIALGPARTVALGELALVQHRLGDVAGLVRTAERMGSTDGDAETQALTDWVRGFALVHTGAVERGRVLLRRARDRMDATPSLRDEPAMLPFVLLALGWLGDAGTAVPDVERRVRIARERGALGILVAVLSMTAHGRADFFADHVGAFADAGEAVELAAHLGYVADAAPAEEVLAWEYAARGRHEDAARHLDRARSLVTRAGTLDVAAHLALTAAFCALCRGDLAAVIALLEGRIATDAGVGSLGEPLGVAPLLVEAYAGSGRRADAASLARRYADATVDPLPATAALVARCRALGSDGDEAASAFAAALRGHAEADDGFETPHTELLYGEWLRRAGRRTEARAWLEQAADGFAAMDLTLWATRAEHELRATGRTARPRRALAEEPLTPQETRIAALAADGMANREVAAALYLSPKTVEHHLSTVYRKRGLRSRAQLTRLFPGSGAP